MHPFSLVHEYWQGHTFTKFLGVSEAALLNFFVSDHFLVVANQKSRVPFGFIPECRHQLFQSRESQKAI